VIPENDLARRRLVTGDVIVTKSSGSPDHIGKCAIFNDPENGKAYYFSNFMLRLRAKKQHADPRWLYYWLTSDSGRFILQQMNSTTTGLRNLSVGQYLQQRVPTPLYSEQRRIADILDKADAIRRKRKQAKRLADELPHALFLDFFGQPQSNSKNWPVRFFPRSAILDLEKCWTQNSKPETTHDHISGI
jgi:type I restriction enzyme S subunit